MKLNIQSIQSLGASVLSVKAESCYELIATCELDGVKFRETISYRANGPFMEDYRNYFIDVAGRRGFALELSYCHGEEQVPEVTHDSMSPIATYAKKRFEQVDKAIRGVTSTFEDFSFHSYVFELHSDGWQLKLPSHAAVTIDSDSDSDDDASIDLQDIDSDDDTPMQSDDVFNSETGETLRDVIERKERRDNWARAIEYELNERRPSFSRDISSMWL